MMPTSPWKEMVNKEGKRYYYNTMTKQSSWDKPADFDGYAGAVPHVPMMAMQGIPQYPYQYGSPAGVMPVHMGMQQQGMGMPMMYPAGMSIQQAMSSASQAMLSLPPGARNAVVNNAELTSTALSTVAEVMARHSGDGGQTGQAQSDEPAAYSSKREASEAFKQMLHDAGVSGDDIWEDILPRILNDARYKALRSTAERKNVFNEYTTNRRKEEREERRIQQKKNRDALKEMLLASPDFNVDMVYKYVYDMVHRHVRRALWVYASEAPWKQFDNDSKLREDIFEEARSEIDRKAKDQKREEKRLAMATFRRLLTSASVDLTWTFARVKTELGTDPAFKEIDPLDRITAYQDHLRELERKDEEERNNEKNSSRREERKAREAFAELLNRMKNDNKIIAGTKWKDIFPLVADEESYKRMIGTSGPRDLFDDLLEVLEDQFEADEKRLKTILSDIGYVVKPTSAYDEILEAIKSHARFSEFTPNNVKGVVEESIYRANKKAEEEKKRKEKAVESFNDLLKRKHVNPTDTWSSVKDNLSHHSGYKAIDTEDERVVLFDKYVNDLKSATVQPDIAPPPSDGQIHNDDKEEGEVVEKMIVE